VPRPDGQLSSSFFICAFQFAFWGAMGFYAPFANVYYRTIGLSGTQIGVIGTLAALMAALGAFAWGLLHDRLGKSRLVFSGICWGMIVFTALLGQLRDYGQILAVAVLLSFFIGPSVSQMDSMTLKMLGTRYASYGSFRMWGTIGFVITSALAGFLLQATSIHSIFIAFPIGVFFFWLVSMRLPDRTIYQGPSLFGGLRQMARNPQWLLMMGSVLVLWTAVISGNTFLGVVMKDMGSSEANVGLASTVAAFAEIPLLGGGPYILRRFGAQRLILAAMVTYTVRLVLYALMVSPAVAIGISLLQSITYCPFLIGAVAMANDLAPDELKSTSQGLLGMVMSLSNVVGGVAGGWLYDHTGQSGLYFTWAATSATALILFSVGILLRQRSKVPAV
jgi:MFS transporter, PPP family, 3-phenylpropionic acid transporter